MSLLTAIVTDSQQRLSELPILTSQERRQILEKWNQTQVNYPKQWLHQQFEAQVEKTPENVAVFFPHPNPPLRKGRENDKTGGVITYRELNSKANQLAHYL